MSIIGNGVSGEGLQSARLCGKLSPLVDGTAFAGISESRGRKDDRKAPSS